MTRRHWDDLPAPVRRAVQAHTGTVHSVDPVAAGSVSELAATIYAESGPVFVKGITAGHAQAWMHRNEARVNPWLPTMTPRLRWTVERDEWLLLGFDHVSGRHADASPGSPDLAALASTLAALSQTPCPPIPVQPATRRWAGRIDPDLVDGPVLAHTDVSLKNFLRAGSVTYVVDWAMPCRGAAWLDTAWMIPRLIQAGHTPAAAEQWARQIPAWQRARPEAVTAFAGALADLWEDRQRLRPAPHRGPLAEAARAWVTYRAAAVAPAGAYREL